MKLSDIANRFKRKPKPVKQPELQIVAPVVPAPITPLRPAPLQTTVPDRVPDKPPLKPAVSAQAPVKPAVPAEPLPEPKGRRVPGTKRQRQFERQVEKARKGIADGAIQPKTREVAEHCGCAYRTALSILATLTTDGLLVRSGKGWKRVE